MRRIDTFLKQAAGVKRLLFCGVGCQVQGNVYVLLGGFINNTCLRLHYGTPIFWESRQFSIQCVSGVHKDP